MSRRHGSILIAVLVLFSVASCNLFESDTVSIGTTIGDNVLMGGGIQGTELVLTGRTTTFAGQAYYDHLDNTGAAAVFNKSEGVATDGTNLYVADTYNHVIRKVVIATGVVTTLAGAPGAFGLTDGTGAAARFYQPAGVAVIGGNLYVADSENHSIRKVVIATGEVTTFAGSTSRDFDYVNGTGTAARFTCPYGIVAVGENLYVSEGSYFWGPLNLDYGNYVVRKIVTATGEVTTLAGTPDTAGYLDSTDGTGDTAKFDNPNGLASDGTNLYVADSGNNVIRKIVIDNGATTTLAGIADDVVGSVDSSDGTGGTARFRFPFGIATDGTNLYVTDVDNYTVRKVVIDTGATTTLAGLARSYGRADGTGGAEGTARFDIPGGIGIVGSNLFVMDWDGGINGAIRRVATDDGETTTPVGPTDGAADGTGSAARFAYPRMVTTDGTFLYLTDSLNRTIRKVAIDNGQVTTLAGNAHVLPSNADNTGFYSSRGITTDGESVFVADSGTYTIRKIVIETGELTTLAGRAWSRGTTDNTGDLARFYYPYGVTTDGTNLYVTDYSRHTIRKVVIATGAVTTFAGTNGSSGNIDNTGTSAKFSYPAGITTDGTNLYVADYGNGAIRKVVIATGVVTTIASSLTSPLGITTDGTNLYVTSNDTAIVLKVVIATGATTTLAGVGGEAGSADSTDGTGATARFYNPCGIVSDGRKLYVADTYNDTIRVIE